MGAGARGVDVSTWQHPGGQPIDWEAVEAAGVTFALVKITQGVGYVNPWGLADLDDARAAGLLVGAYHYYEVGAPAAEQAAHMVGSLMGQHLDLGVFLDWEPAPMDQWAASGQVNAFLEAAKEGRPGCGLYCDVAWWDMLRGAGVQPPKLWLAAWSETTAPAGSTIWQSGTGTVAGIPAEVDLDVLTSTRGINLPSAPKPRPSAATTTPVHVEPEPDDEENEERPGP